jgi:hypothetical protein
MRDEPPLTLGLTNLGSAGAAGPPMARARVMARIDRVWILPKLLITPIVFWVGAAAIYIYRKWVPAGLLAFWPLIPALLLIFTISLWPGPAIKGIDIYPKLGKARLVWKVSLWVCALAFPVAAIILFVARPDLFGLAGRMLWWGLTHVVAPYPY